MDDFLLELDRELSVATSRAKLQSDVSKARGKLLSSTISAEAKGALREEYAHLSEELNKILWRPIASVAFFAVQSCDGCASVHKTFLSHMQRQASVTNRTVMRWVRTPKPIPDLPTEVIMQATKTHICADCCHEFGFDLSTAEVKFSKYSEPFSVSVDYLQEEM